MTSPGRPAIRLDGLCKSFGSFRAVDGLTVEVPSGGVVGLLGPNGAGKSTTIRMLLGLIKPTAGTAEVLGSPTTRPVDFIDRVGALIEAPVFYPKLSGENNLRTLAALQDVPRTRIDEVLEIVGLDGRGNDRAGDYSLGMKQRLAIAAALLRDPDLLILDEPTNGLGPAGIVEIRHLLQSLGAAGKTVFVSSHLLAEIQAACDRLVIIDRGRLVFEGSLPELLAQAVNEVVLTPEHPDDMPQLVEVMASAGIEGAPGGAQFHVAGTAHPTSEINRAAFASGITLSELRIEREDLEDVFLRMTGDYQEDRP